MMASAPWVESQFQTKGVEALLEAAQLNARLHITFLWRGHLLAEMKQRLAQADLNAQETYDVFIDRLPSPDMYLKAPYFVTPGGIHTLRIGTRGATIVGGVTDSEKKKNQPGAVVTLIPESYQPQLFREGYVDQNGFFTITGVAPGTYIAVPWLDVPPCELNVPREIDTCRAKGKTVTVKEGEQSLVELTIPPN